MHLRFVLRRIALFSYIITLFITLASAQEVVIHEIMAHPQAVAGREPTELEYLELANLSDQLVDLSGWQLDRGVAFTFPSETNLEAGGFLVIVADPEAFALRYPEVAKPIGPWVGRLGNSGNTIRLVNRSKETVDQVAYSDEGDWATRSQVTVGGQLGWEWFAAHDGGGASLELIDPRLPNQIGSNWGVSTVTGGTPENVNSIAVTIEAPLIDQVSHYPPVPRPQDPVIVRARISQKLEQTFEAFVHYRVSTLMPGFFLTEIAMVDDAGQLVATIPPHRDQSVIEFYVEVRTASASRTWPADEDRALYQVHQATEEGDQPFYYVVMPVNEDARFRPEVFPSGSNAQMNATFIVSQAGETTVRYRAGIRRRGNSSRGRNPRSFRLSLPNATPWQGASRLNLLGQYTYLQTLGLRLCQSAGLPAPDAKLIQLRLNGVNYANPNNNVGAHYGSYAHIEPLNGDFAEKAFPEDSNGDLYRKISANPSRDRKRWGVHFDDQVVYNNPNWYLTDRWSKESNGAANDWSRFQEFIVTMNEAPSESKAYLDAVSKQVNVDQWLRWFGLMNLINNRETNLSNGIDDDYSMYQGFRDPRFVLLPHDLDTIFGLGDTRTSFDATVFQMLDTSFGSGASVIPQLEHFFNYPGIRPRYFDHLQDLLMTTLLPERLDELVEGLLSHVPVEVRDRIKNFNRQRRKHVLAVINSGPKAEVALPVAGGVFLTTEAGVSLEGTVSPRLVTEVRIQGQLAEYDPGRGRWAISNLPLRPDINTIAIQGLGGEGHVVSKTQLEIRRLRDTPSEILRGTVIEDRILTAEEGPYRVEGEWIIPAGRTLTIESGTTLNFSAGAHLQVIGTLIAEGRKHDHIRFAADAESWRGVRFESSTTSRLEHTQIVGTAGDAIAISLVDAFVHLESLDFRQVKGASLHLERSAIELIDSVLPDFTGKPQFVSQGEWLAGFPIVIEGNIFGAELEALTFIQVDQPAQDRIIEVRSNHFPATIGAALSIPGRVFIDGNQFEFTSTALSLTDSEAVISRNRFEGTDLILAVRGGSTIRFEHNAAQQAGVLVNPQDGLNIHVANNVFAQTEIDSELDQTHNLSVEHIDSLVRVDAGTHGQDLGPTGSVGLRGHPFAVTPKTELKATISSPGMESARFRLNEEAWVDSLNGAIDLSNLAAGEHRLQVMITDVGGRESAAIEVARWQVDPSGPPVIVHEVAAAEEMDWVELKNVSDECIDLTGYRLTDDPDASRFILVPNGTMLEPGALTTISLGDGFGLSKGGDELHLFDTHDEVIDSVRFGQQLTGHSLSRTSSNPNLWALGILTPGESNQRVTQSLGVRTRINEWYANSGTAVNEDFVELINREPWPVALSGFQLISTSDEVVMDPLHFLAAQDLEERRDIRLNASFGSLELQDTQGEVLDRVIWQAQSDLASQGRVPDGSNAWQILTPPSPGDVNEMMPEDAQLLNYLRITEIFFHPSNDQEEWLELMNTGDEPLELGGARFDRGITFTFPELTLAPGERGVIVADEAAFRARYGNGPLALGEFEGRLNNTGEELRLRSAPVIQRFTYDNVWYPLTETDGHSLVIRNPEGARAVWNEPEAWRASDARGGSPAEPDAPVIYSERQATTILNDPFAFQVQATNQPDNFTATGLPTGLMLDPATGEISGMVTAAGTYVVLLTAANSTGEDTRELTVVVNASGPATTVVWHDLPDEIVQETAFPVNLRILDDAGRLVTDYEGSLNLQASAPSLAVPELLITEICDDDDRLAIAVPAGEANTTGWRLFLNAATDADIQAIHGVDGVGGRVWPFPDTFSSRTLNENALRFGLNWSARDRVGGRRGWALIANERNEAVDFVSWGYSLEDLQSLVIRDDLGQVVTGDYWRGVSVPYVRPENSQLFRVSSIDTNSASDWAFVDGGFQSPSEYQSRRDVTISPTISEAFVAGTWHGSMTVTGFGEGYRFNASDTLGILDTTSLERTVLPVGLPQLPEAIHLRAVVGQPWHYRIPTDNRVSTLTAEGLLDGLLLEASTATVSGQIGEPGKSVLTVLAGNVLGTTRMTLAVTALSDDDGDGLADAWESINGYDASLASDAAEDRDGDGSDALEEFLAGTDPDDATSRFAIEGVDQDAIGGAFRLCWSSIPGQLYQIALGEVVSGALVWTAVADSEVMATAGKTSAAIQLELKPQEGRLLRVESLWTRSASEF